MIPHNIISPKLYGFIFFSFFDMLKRRYMKEEIYAKMNNHNQNLSEYACPDNEAIYLEENKKDIMNPFF